MALKRRKIEQDRIPDAIAHKWSRPVLEEGFVPFPKKLIRCMGDMFTGPRGMDHLRVLLTVIDYRRPDLVRPPSLEYLAFNSGISEEEFEERLQELEQRKWISRSGPPEAINVEVTGFLREIGRRAGKV